MSPSDVRDAIVTVLGTAFPTWTVEAHGGALTERELPMLLSKAPCLLVSLQRFATFLPKGPRHWSATLDWIVTVIGRDEADTDTDIPRAEVALKAVFSLLASLSGQRWGLTDAKPPDADSLRAENLQTVHVNNLRVALWAVSWTQTFTLESSP